MDPQIPQLPGRQDVVGGRRGRRRRSVAVVLVMLVVPLLLVAELGSAVPAGAQDPSDAARRLAERHVPVMMLGAQPEPCDPEGEPFLPMSVDAVLDNPDVALRQVGNDDPVLTWGPSAADLFERGRGFYLDYPGSALEPGCTYEQDFRRYQRGRAPTVYAHLAREAGADGMLALQYWFFSYYNDWNNKHESDWEGIQLLFQASTAEEALQRDPVAVGYAQHEGGERAGWDDDKLERDGPRPVVYTSVRSHASYFASEVYIGRGASQGFGCDDTAGPAVRVDPEVIVLPDTVERADDEFAWLAFDGTWGERQRGPFNGPTGLLTKARWSAPVTWQDDLRRGSVIVPAGDSSAHDVVDAFCSVVEFGSRQLIELQLSPLQVLLTVAGLYLGARFLVRRTTWTATDASPLVRRRRAGQIVRTAWSIFRERPVTFLAIGALAIPLTALAALAVSLADALPVIGALIELTDAGGGGSRVVLSAVTGGVATAFSFTFVTAAVAATIGGDRPGAAVSIDGAVAAVRARWKELLGAFAIVAAIIIGLLATVVGAPLALFLLVRWQFLPQAVVLGGCGALQAPRASARLVRRRWLHTALVAGSISAVVLGSGFVAALLVLVVFSSLPLWFLSVVSSAVGAALLPVGDIALTLLYGDAVAQNRERAATQADAPAGVRDAPV